MANTKSKVKSKLDDVTVVITGPDDASDADVSAALERAGSKWSNKDFEPAPKPRASAE